MRPNTSFLSRGVKPWSIRTSDLTLPSNLEAQVVQFVAGQKNRFFDARAVAEERWKEAWALYVGSPEAMAELRSKILTTVGDVNVDWRHHINVGKAFEAVETIHGYLMAATFPNRDWFNVIPRSPNDLKLAQLVQKYHANKLDDANFKSHYGNFLRQCIITGNSVLALPWRYETTKYKKKVKLPKPKGTPGFIDLDEDQDYTWEVVEEDRVIQNHPDFETIDMFDVAFDTNIPDANRADMVRRLYKTKAEVIQCIVDGTYDDIPLNQVQHHKAYTRTSETDGTRSRNIYQGVNNDVAAWSMSDIVEVWEYWGDVHLDDVTYKDVVVTLLGDDTLLRMETNPYWGGRPFVIGTYIPVMQTYAMGAIEPNMGLLHELNIVTNQRLDNMELSIDQMYTLRADGLLQPDQVWTEPGKVFLVADHNDLQPLNPPTANYPITYQETSVLEQFIDKNFGTGPLIGGGQPRGGERVTAEEIQAVRDAGGNRLSNVHKHLEDTALLPLLQKLLRLSQQFVTEDELVRVAAGDQDGSFEYYQIGPEELNGGEWFLKPLGADYVADRKKYVQQRLDFLAAVTQIPQMAQRLNYDAILRDLVTHFGFDDPDSYLVDAPSPMAPTEAGTEDPNAAAAAGVPDPGNTQIAQDLFGMGGAPLQQAVMNDLNAGGMEQVSQKYLGVPAL